MNALAILAMVAVTPANVQVAAATAKPGDTLRLSGDFPPLVLSGRKDLTIDATKATFNGLRIANSSNIKLTGGEYTASDWGGGIYVAGSKGVSISDVSVDGVAKFNGITFRDSSDVSLNGAHIRRPRVGVSILHVTGAALRTNAVVEAGVDGMDIASSHDVLAEFNSCADTKLVDQQHPDCIQLWSITGEPPTSNITLRKNKASGPTQGFTAFDHGTGGFDNITIEDNDVLISYSQGVAIYNARGSAVKNNHIRTADGAPYRASVNVIGAVDTMVCGNVAEAGAGKPESRDKPCK